MSRRDLKQIILDAALAVFSEHGFEGATTAQILERAGVSNGALFHHFPTKDAVAEALYLRGIASYQEGLVETLERHRGSASARSAVKAAVYHHLAWVETNRDLAWFMYERGRPDWQPAHGAAVRKLNRAAARHVYDWMTPLVKSGVVRDLPLTVLGAFVNGPAHFIARRWLSGLISAPPTSFSEVLADTAWAAIAPRRSKTPPATQARPSVAALFEMTALDAAQSTGHRREHGHWTIVSLAIVSGSQPVDAAVEAARVQSVQISDDGRVASVDLVLVANDGDAAARGHVICSWRENITTSKKETGERSA